MNHFVIRGPLYYGNKLSHAITVKYVYEGITFFVSCKNELPQFSCVNCISFHTKGGLYNLMVLAYFKEKYYLLHGHT